MSLFKYFLAALVFSLAFISSAQADWVLLPESRLEFVSTKNGSNAEVNHFERLKGTISAEGSAEIRIDINSVETNIPIRNERLKGLLFKTVKFPEAIITATLPASVLHPEPDQAFTTANITARLWLRGRSDDIEATINVAYLRNGQVLVTSRAPIIISAEDFGMSAGIHSLKTLASLKSISSAVPVSFSLLFEHTSAE